MGRAERLPRPMQNESWEGNTRFSVLSQVKVALCDECYRRISAEIPNKLDVAPDAGSNPILCVPEDWWRQRLIRSSRSNIAQVKCWFGSCCTARSCLAQLAHVFGSEIKLPQRSGGPALIRVRNSCFRHPAGKQKRYMERLRLSYHWLNTSWDLRWAT